MAHFSFRPHVVRVVPLLAAVVIVAALTVAVTSRGASSTSTSCSATSLELVGTLGTPSVGVPVIDLTGDYATAETSVTNLGNPSKASVKLPLDFNQITVAISGCAIEYDSTAPSVAISGTATNILPGGDPQETSDLLILATWPGPVVSLGGHVNGDFDLARIHSAFQAPQGLKPAFSEVWFTQSNAQQTPPARYAGQGKFYPPGHVIPVGVAFRGELDLASVIGNVLAGNLGGVPVSIQGGVPVANGVTIYNNVLSVQNEFTLEGQIDLSGVNGLPYGISFPDDPQKPWKLTLNLKPTATNAQGNLSTFGIQTGVEGWMAIEKSLLNTQNDLLLQMQAKFEYDWASDAAVVDFVVTAQGPWSDLFGMNGFSANSVKVLLRASTKPDAHGAKIAVTGTFTTANSFTFALTFEVIEKNNKFSAKVIAEALSDITVADLLTAFAALDKMDLVAIDPDASSVLNNITLTGLRAAVKFDTAGASVFVTADAQVYDLSTSVAFYLGPEKPADSNSKYGFLFGAYVDSVALVDLIPVLPASLNLTLPETIFYVSSLRFDADEFGYPDPALFYFFDRIYGTGGGVNNKITVEAGAGLLANIQTPPIPQDLQKLLEEGLWMDFNQGMLLAGNVPLFGKTGFSLTLYLPEVVPQESDHAPEWFEHAQLYVQMAVDGANVSFRAQGDLTIRLRKDGVPAPASYSQIRYQDYDHLTFSVAGDVAITPPTVNVNLTGQVQAPGGWHPLGQQWLTIQQLAIVLNVGTTPEGNAKIGFGLGGAIVLGTPPNQLDLEASFLIGVKTLKVFPWATANIDGFRFQTDRGLRTDDLILLAEFFAGRSLGVSDAALASLPKLAISDLEISYSKVDNAPLCLRKGFRISGDLYVNADPPSYQPRPPCDYERPDGTPDNRPELGANCVGCLGGIDIEIVLPGANPPKIKGLFDLQAFDIGQTIHVGPAKIDLEISQQAVYLKVNGQMTIDNVGSGMVNLQFTPTNYVLTADAKLFNAFWAYLDANLGIGPQPSLWAHGELKAEFGSAMASVLENETRNLRALLATFDQLYADFQDPSKDLDDLTDSLINLAPTLKANGAKGPLINLMATFATEVQKAKANAEAAGMYPSLDKIVNVILGGATITITEGVPGSWVDAYCIGYVNRWGTCIGVWVPAHCRLMEVDGQCWIVPPITFEVPGICPSIVNLPAYGEPCSSQGLKNLAARAVDDAVYNIFGFRLGPTLHDMATRDLPVLFDVNCAAFDIDLGSQADNTIGLFLGITLLGKPVVWQGTWDFDATFAQNIGNNRQFLLTFIRSILSQGTPPDPYAECTRTGAPPPGGSLGTPTDLTVSAPASVSEGVQFTLQAAFKEDGVKPGDVRTYTIAWGDGNTTTATLAAGQTSFNVPYTYDDDPVGANDNRQITVTVTNARAGSTSKSTTIKVNNAAPTAGAPQLSAAAVDEGQTVTVTGSFSDLGAVGKDTHTVLIAWNDGSQPTPATVDQQNRTYTAQHTYLDDNPTGTAQDTIQISVQIRDDDGGSVQTGTSLTVRNVPPDVQSLTVTPLSAGPPSAGTAPTTPSADFYEGDQFVVEGAFSDAGKLDTHMVKVEWRGQGQADWQVFSEIGLKFSQRSFSITLPLPDDDPSGTPEDPVTVKVTVEDDDLGTFSQEFPIILKNRDPEDVTVTPTSTSINEDDTVGVTVNWTDAGLADSHVIVIDWGDGEQTVLDTIEVGEREAQASHHYRDDAKTPNPADTYTITATVTDDDTGSGTGNATIIVNDVPPVVRVDTDSQSVQYSDPMTEVTVTATDVETDPLSATTSWAGGAVAPTGDLANAGLPDWLTLSADGNCVMDSVANLRTCTWTLSPQLSGAGVHSDAPPGVYTVRVKITDDDTLFATVDTVIEILPEDAIAYYVGPTFVSRVAASNGDDEHGNDHGRDNDHGHGDDDEEGNADIELRANVRDITTALAGPDAPWDPYPGDIRNARVTFVDMSKSPGEAGYELCSAEVDAIFIVGGQPDTNIGTAACLWQVDIGDAVTVPLHDEEEDEGPVAVPFDIGVVVGGRYTNNLFPEQTIVTVAEPIDEHITGGGYLTLKTSAGAYAGDTGSKAKFEFNVKFNKKGRDLHGKAKLRFRIGDRTYEIKTKTIQSLGVVGHEADPHHGRSHEEERPQTAQFEAKATLIDITNRKKPIVLGEDLSFQMMMTDSGERCDEEESHRGRSHGERCNADTISFTLWEGKTGRQQRLLFSSAWDGNRTIEQVVGHGSLEVHD